VYDGGGTEEVKTAEVGKGMVFKGEQSAIAVELSNLLYHWFIYLILR
jgi:hypothetical protein